MSDFVIEIYGTTNIVEVETSFLDTVNNIEIETTSSQTVEINSGYVASYATDIIGLDGYIGDFIDSYEIDCGSP